MTAAFVLLLYICAMPAEGVRVLSCVAREIAAPSCAEAAAIAEAGLAPDRLMLAVACVATTDGRGRR